MHPAPRPFSTIRGKLGMMLGAVLVLVTGLGMFSLQQLRTVNVVTMEMAENWWPKARMINDMEQSATTHRLLATRRMETQNFRQLAEVESGLQKSVEEIANARAAFDALCEHGSLDHSDHHHELFNTFDQRWSRYLASFQAVTAQRDGGELEAASTAFNSETLKLFDSAFLLLEDVNRLLDAESHAAENKVSATRTRAETMIYLAMGAVLLLVLRAMFWVRKSISIPLREVSETMDRLTRGDAEHVEIGGGSRTDEIGVLVSATRGYRDSLIRSREYAEQLQNERNEAMILSTAAIDANNAKSMLLANVSHELRTPMNAICGFSDVMVSEVFGPVHPPRYAEYVEGIHGSARALLNNINDLLDVSSLEVEKFGWRDIEFDPVKAVEQALSTSRASAPNRRVDLSVDLPRKTDLAAKGDPERLGQALINLVGNAIKFSDDDTPIFVKIEEAADNRIAIHVIDEGCGIAPGDVERILKPFGQVNENRYLATEGGLGLGLAITQEIIRRFEGELIVESIADNGTTFSVLLPCRLVSQVSRGEAA